jgi:S1-C subfamily serine protease
MRKGSFLAPLAVLALNISNAGAVNAVVISSGSGILIGTNGEVLTNAHVVKECHGLVVKFASGDSQPGVLIASDEGNDLAIVCRPSALVGHDGLIV